MARPSDAIWRHRYGSISAQAMACCLEPRGHCLNQYWFIISKVQSHSSKAISQEIPQPSLTKINLKKHLSEISFKSPMGQWSDLNLCEDKWRFQVTDIYCKKTRSIRMFGWSVSVSVQWRYINHILLFATNTNNRYTMLFRDNSYEGRIIGLYW